jgi:hypothetical protein
MVRAGRRDRHDGNREYLQASGLSEIIYIMIAPSNSILSKHRDMR